MKIKLLIIFLFSLKVYGQEIPERFINADTLTKQQFQNFSAFLDTLKAVYKNEFDLTDSTHKKFRISVSQKLISDRTLDTFMYRVFDKIIFNKEGILNNGSGGLISLDDSQQKLSLSFSHNSNGKLKKGVENPKIWKYDLNFDVKNNVGTIYKKTWQKGIEFNISRLIIPYKQKVIYNNNAYKTIVSNRLKFLNEFIKTSKKYFLVDTIEIKNEIERLKKKEFRDLESIEAYKSLIAKEGISAQMNNEDSVIYFKEILHKVKMFNNLSNDIKSNFSNYLKNKIVKFDKENLPQNLGYKLGWHSIGIKTNLFKNSFESDTAISPLVIESKGNGLFIKFGINYSYNLLKYIPEPNVKKYISQKDERGKPSKKDKKSTLRLHQCSLSLYNTNLLELISKAEIPIVKFDSFKGDYFITTNTTDTLQTLESFNNNFLRLNAGYSYIRYFGKKEISPLGMQVDFNTKLPLGFLSNKIITKSILANAVLVDMNVGLLYNTNQSKLSGSLIGVFVGYNNYPIASNKKLNDYFSFEIKYGVSFNKLFY